MRGGREGRMLGSALALGLALSLTACGEAPPPGSDLAQWDRVDHTSPAPVGSGEPNLFATPDGRTFLSWLEPLEGGERHALRFSLLPAERWEDPEGWSPPRTIVTGDDFFVNWADFPSIHVLPDGRMAAHWLVRSGPDTFDYDVHVAWSMDDGDTWSDSVVPHRDGTLSEHGFVSLFPWTVGPPGSEEEPALGAVWLDGRDFASGSEDPEMSLRFTTLQPGGLGEEILLDERICDCCQTSAAVTAQGPVVVYRDRTEEEIRDISIVRAVADSPGAAAGESGLGAEEGSGLAWTDPVPIHEDGWVIPACPVNGPMVAARGQLVAVAWFTAAQDTPRVKLAFSTDAGASFGPPIQIDDGDPLGRVAVVLSERGTGEEGDQGQAFVSWLERTEEGADIRVRAVEGPGATPGGTVGPSFTLAQTTHARSGGFPRMTALDGGILLAWNDVDGSGRVETTVLRRPDPEGGRP